MKYLPFVRIILRYASGALVSVGWIAPQMGATIATNGDVAAIAAGAIGVLMSEGGYAVAKWRGGAT